MTERWAELITTVSEAHPLGCQRRGDDYHLTSRGRVDWILGKFGPRLREAQRAYQQFVSEGMRAVTPWRQVRGQIYLGDETFVARHQPHRPIREVPRGQTQAHRPTLPQLFARPSTRDRMVAQAYRR